MTFPEILLWQKIKSKQIMGYDFDRQIAIDIYIVDFYCKDLKLAIEIDGSDHDYHKDTIRQDRLESLGVHFLRFSNREIKYKMTEVLTSFNTWIEVYNEKTSQPNEP